MVQPLNHLLLGFILLTGFVSLAQGTADVTIQNGNFERRELGRTDTIVYYSTQPGKLIIRHKGKKLNAARLITGDNETITVFYRGNSIVHADQEKITRTATYIDSEYRYSEPFTEKDISYDFAEDGSYSYNLRAYWSLFESQKEARYINPKALLWKVHFMTYQSTAYLRKEQLFLQESDFQRTELQRVRADFQADSLYDEQHRKLYDDRYQETIDSIRLKIRSGNFDQAWEKIIEARPRYPNSRELESLKKLNTDTAIYSVALNEAQAAEQSGKLSAAATAYRLAFDYFPNDPFAESKLKELLPKLKKAYSVAAFKSLEKQFKHHRHKEVYTLASSLPSAYNLNEYVRVMMVLNQSEIRTGQVKLMIQYANRYYKEKEPETAALLYRKCIERYGPNAKASEMLVKIRQLLSSQSNASVHS